MKPVVYEIRRALTSKSMIILFVVVIAMPVLIAFVSTSSMGASPSTSSIAYGEGQNGTFNVTVFLYNQFGVPVQGTAVTFVAGSNSTSVMTGSNGFANVTFHKVNSSVVEKLSSGYRSNITYTFGSSANNNTASGNHVLFEYSVPIYQEGENPYFSSSTVETGINGNYTNVTTYSARFYFSSFPVQNHPIQQTLGLIYRPVEQNISQPVLIYFKQLNASSYPYGGGNIEYSNLSNRSIVKQGYFPSGTDILYNESQMTFLGSFQGSPLDIADTTKLAGGPNDTRYIFEAFTPNGTEMAWYQIQLINPFSLSHVNSLFYTTELPVLGLFVPLMAVLAGFLTFGRDKVSGALNYVVVRPISRTSIITSRYVSNILSIFVPSAISIGISSAVFRYYLGAYIPADAIYLSLWSVLVMAAGYCGIIYLGSAVTRSSGKLIGLVLGVFLLLDLFWSFTNLPLIPQAVTSLFPLDTLKYATIYVLMDFISPSGFTSLVAYLGIGNTSSPVYLGNFFPYQVGITIFSLIAVGIAWIIIPFILSVIKFSKFD